MEANFSRRSQQQEHLDKGDYTKEEFEQCLIELQWVNRWLGDARTLRHTVLQQIRRRDKRHFYILDVGAGSGELLRVAAQWAARTQKTALLAGVELNPASARAILKSSKLFPEIVAVRADAFRLPFADKQFDYTISSLFTHHFSDDLVVALLKEMTRVTRWELCVMDLHRHPIPYYFYITVGRVLLKNRLTREDGALSILRSFKPDELLALARRAGLQQARLERHFPYRLALRAPIEYRKNSETELPDEAGTSADKAA